MSPFRFFKQPSLSLILPLHQLRIPLRRDPLLPPLPRRLDLIPTHLHLLLQRPLALHLSLGFMDLFRICFSHTLPIFVYPQVIKQIERGKQNKE